MRMPILVASILALAGLAQAADTTTFKVDGTNPDGGRYTGTVKVTELSNTNASGDTFDVEWTVGSAVVKGVGIVLGSDRNTLAVGYPAAGGAGVLLIKVDAGGNTAKGEWRSTGMAGVGTETWTISK